MLLRNLQGDHFYWDTVYIVTAVRFVIVDFKEMNE